jgi:hypothetical protein
MAGSGRSHQARIAFHSAAKEEIPMPEEPLVLEIFTDYV